MDIRKLIEMAGGGGGQADPYGSDAHQQRLQGLMAAPPPKPLDDKERLDLRYGMRYPGRFAEREPDAFGSFDYGDKIRALMARAEKFPDVAAQANLEGIDPAERALLQKRFPGIPAMPVAAAPAPGWLERRGLGDPVTARMEQGFPGITTALPPDAIRTLRGTNQGTTLLAPGGGEAARLQGWLDPSDLFMQGGKTYSKSGQRTRTADILRDEALRDRLFGLEQRKLDIAEQEVKKRVDPLQKQLEAIREKDREDFEKTLAARNLAPIDREIERQRAEEAQIAADKAAGRPPKVTPAEPGSLRDLLNNLPPEVVAAIQKPGVPLGPKESLQPLDVAMTDLFNRQRENPGLLPPEQMANLQRILQEKYGAEKTKSYFSEPTLWQNFKELALNPSTLLTWEDQPEWEAREYFRKQAGKTKEPSEMMKWLRRNLPQ